MKFKNLELVDLIKFFILLSLFLISFSCSETNSNKESRETILYHFSDAGKAYQIEILKDVDSCYVQIDSLKQEFCYNKSSLELTVKSFYENGNINSIKTYLANKPNGVSKSFFENGEIQSINNFYDGEFQGEQILFHRSGNLYAYTYVEEGVKFGLTYDNKGSYLAEGSPVIVYEINNDSLELKILQPPQFCTDLFINEEQVKLNGKCNVFLELDEFKLSEGLDLEITLSLENSEYKHTFNVHVPLI